MSKRGELRHNLKFQICFSSHIYMFRTSIMKLFENSLKVKIYSPSKLHVTIQFAGSQRKCVGVIKEATPEPIPKWDELFVFQVECISTQINTYNWQINLTWLVSNLYVLPFLSPLFRHNKIFNLITIDKLFIFQEEYIFTQINTYNRHINLTFMYWQF